MSRLLATLSGLAVLAGLLVAPASAQAAGIAGRVTDAGGGPVPGAVVSLVAAGDPDSRVATTTAAGDGTWRLDPADGNYRLHAADPRGALADGWWSEGGTDVLRVTGGSGPEDLRIALPAGAVIAGRVTGPDGPVAGAALHVERTPFALVEFRTGSDGRFRLPGLRAGEHTVHVATARLPVAPTQQQVRVAAGETVEVTIVLRSRPVGVERVAGRERVATAVEASRRGFPSATTVVIAAAGSFPDALAAAPLAAAVEGPLLLVGPRLGQVVLDELRRLGAQEAVVVGAVAAVPLVVQDEIARAGLAVRRIAGDSRFDTAALIAREVGAESGEAIVVSGLEFADALSVAPLAAAQRIPILLTAPGALSADAGRALADLGVTRTLVVGGTAAVSDAVLRALPAATRVSGRTRYETSLAVAEHAVGRGLELQTVSVATGRNFPDALAAGPVAALAGGPLLLVDGRDPATPAATYAWLSARQDEIIGAYVFGGSGVVTDAVVDRLRRAMGGTP